MHHEQDHLEAIGGRAAPSGRTGPASSFHVGTSVSALSSIHDPAVAIAVWQRALPEGVGEALAAGASAVGSGFEGIVDPARVDLSPTVAGIADVRARAWLLSDATSLVDRFTSLAGSSLLRLSLGAVSDDQCRRFHVDYLRLRLVTTYAGPGTEWLPEEAVDREALERVDRSPAEANRHILRDPSALRCARAGDVLLMKGSRYPSLHGGGAVHRSPPIDGTGHTRIVLVLSTFDPPV